MYIDKYECDVSCMASEYIEKAKIFKALCDENRLRILELLRSGEKCACKLLEELRISQSTLSHHMKLLCNAGVVQGRKEGKWVHYSIDPQGAEKAVELLKEQLKVNDAEKTGCCRRDT